MGKNKLKSDFISLLMDENFVRMVQSLENHDEFIEQLIQGDKVNVKAVRYAIQFIRMNQLKNINQLKKEKMDTGNFNRIMKEIQEHAKMKSNARGLKQIPFWLRIAAMLLIFFSVGGSIIYYHSAKNPLIEFAQQGIADTDQGLLILSDGSKQVLKDNDSFIDYNSTEGEVVIKKDNEEKIIQHLQDKDREKETALNQIVVPYGQRHKVLLNDGTLVYLNAGSRLIYPAKFSGRNREVYLSGEGFFEVSKNAEVPFIVRTDNIDIKVLGTKFNVSAYADERYISTVLVEGKVNVLQKEKLFVNARVSLDPGQGCFYSIKDKRSVVRDVDVADYVSWKDGMYKFRNTPLRDVAGRIGRHYNQPVQIQGDELANTTFSGKFMLTEDLDEVLRNLSKTLEGRLEKADDGTYILKQ